MYVFLYVISRFLYPIIYLFVWSLLIYPWWPKCVEDNLIVLIPIDICFFSFSYVNLKHESELLKLSFMRFSVMIWIFDICRLIIMHYTPMRLKLDVFPSHFLFSYDHAYVEFWKEGGGVDHAYVEFWKEVVLTSNMCCRINQMLWYLR